MLVAFPNHHILIPDNDDEATEAEFLLEQVKKSEKKEMASNWQQK